MHQGHDRPASFHGSRPSQEAMQAPQEEFLYLAALHQGTGVESPTSSRSSMPRRGG